MKKYLKKKHELFLNKVHETYAIKFQKFPLKFKLELS